jgi:3-keto-disaccharide hydrolase/VCBS repeat protein
VNIKRISCFAGAALFTALAFGAGLSFVPDYTLKGSSLTGWHTLGQANWTAHNGEVTGTVKDAGTGGWLILDRGYQDVGFHASFRCTGGCKTGILLRAEKVADGMKGIYVSLLDGDIAPYRVTLDARGQETQRERLRAAGGMVRIAPPVDPNAAARGGRGGAGAGRGRGVSTVTLPIARPVAGLRPDDWNQVEVLIDANIVRTYINEGGEIGGAADDDAGRFGPVALYAGGAGEVRFKDVAFKDLAFKTIPQEKVSPNFRVQRINDMYYSWSAAAADFNHDGVLDIVAGPYIYYGPDFTKSRELYPAVALSPSKDFTGINCQYAYDFNGDGWPDILTGPPRATVYINPKGESRRWDKFEVLATNVQTEITLFRDVDGDGKPELIYGAEGMLRYAKPTADPTKPWTVHNISEPGYSIAHGIGVGDINGDGRMDVINPYGWWEQPPAGSQQTTWTYHPEAFARYGRNILGGSVMAVFDVNGDGLNDVVTNLNAHGFGLAWFEQKRDSAGKISFVQHMVVDDYSGTNSGDVFSEPHGATFADVNGDGIPDFIAGKRYFSHLDSQLDPDPYGPPVLYWYKTVRNPKAPGGAELIPEMIHNRSGAGSDVLAVDLNKDGAIDIVTSTDRGTFIFWGKPHAASAKAPAAPPKK